MIKSSLLLYFRQSKVNGVLIMCKIQFRNHLLVSICIALNYYSYFDNVIDEFGLINTVRIEFNHCLKF